MRTMLVLTLLGALAAPPSGAADRSINIATAAKVTCDPPLDGEVATWLTGKLTATAFKVGSKGPSTVTFTFAEARQISGVRFSQASDIYRLDACVVEGDADGSGTFKLLATCTRTPLREWVTISFNEVALRAVRLRATAGVAKGQRAYPVYAGLQVLGRPLPTDQTTAAKLGNPVTGIASVLPARQSTPLVSGGRQPVIVAPATGPGHEAAQHLAQALGQRLGQPPAVVATIAEAPLGQATVLALGSLLDNPVIDRLYWSWYTFEDALFPGPTGHTIHTVYDPYPWGGQQDVIILGASRPTQLGAAVERFLGCLQGTGAAAALPYTLIVEPSRRLTATARQALLAKPVDPSFTDFRRFAELYLQSGEEAYAQQAMAALDIMVEVYRGDAHRHVPWPEETTSGEIAAAWDAFEECPLIPPAKRQAYVNAFYSFTAGLEGNCYEYRAIDDNFQIAWNHTTFPLLGLYFGSRYLDRYYHLPQAAEWLRRAKLGFNRSARSSKPPEDADSYIPHTMEHIIRYSLAEGDLRFFTSGKMKQYADYVVGYGDNRQWPSGFGDSGVSSAPVAAVAALPIGYWWTKDGGYRWLLEQSVAGWKNPYWQDVPAVAPARFVGLNVFPLDPIIYAYTQAGPTYNETFVKSDVAPAQAFDKISFRENWDATGQYLQLDGLGRGKHLHFDTNAVIEFVQNGERWLLDHDYLTRNTTEHAMLTVLRDGRANELVPSLAGLSAAGDLPAVAATVTTVNAYNGVDWERRILWHKGGWFLVQDSATARAAGDYDLETTWKTIDRGRQTVDDLGRFIAARGGSNASAGVAVVADPEAANGKVAVLTEATSRLLFEVELPAGKVGVNVVAKAVDTSSDSVWVSLDNGDPIACHLSIGKYGPTSATPAKELTFPTVEVAKAGRHVVRVTLRESPPVRIDRFEFVPAKGDKVVVEAETAPAPPVSAEAKELVDALHIDAALPVNSRVTNHVRSGIAVPVSVLHQRLPRRLAAGDTARLCSLVYATDARHPATYTIQARGEQLYDVTSGAATAVAGFGPATLGRWRFDAAAWLVDGTTVSLVAAKAVSVGPTTLKVTVPADVQWDVATGQIIVRAKSAGQLTMDDQTSDLPAGERQLTVKPADASLLADLTPAAAAAAPALKTPPAPAAQAVWTAKLTAGAPVLRLTTVDFGQGPSLVAACGPAAWRLDGGRVAWSQLTGGVVRDVAPLRRVKGAPPSLLVSSADTYLYELDAAGHEQRKQQMTGIYFSADHGERPWPVWCTRAFDTTGKGVDDLIVTTLASMESWGLDLELHKKWRRLAAYHGSLDVRGADLDGDGKLSIVVADKYGAVHVLRPDGVAKFANNTSIGDVAFDFVDAAGGTKNIVHGSSTGDLRCVDHTGQELWRFDNYGYPVERLVGADVDGDGHAEVLLASGTGYLYCLDGQGHAKWSQRLGFAVHDLALASGRIYAGTEDGTVHALDGQGHEQWRVHVGAPVRKLAVSGDTLACGLADGRVVGLQR